MALDNKILKDFFDKNKVSPISTSIKKFRVFDDPDYKQKETEDKTTSQLETKRRQSVDNAETNKRRRASSFYQSEDKVEPQQETKQETNWRQVNENTTSSTNYSSLTGLQRIITLFIYDQCKIARSSSTNQIAIEFLSIRCQTTKSSAKKTIQRLIAKDIIARAAYKDGRNGWSKYQLNNHVYQEISLEESRGSYMGNWRQTRDEVGTQLETQPKTTFPSSSSLKQSTTKEEGSRLSNTELPLDWQAIDFSSLASIGFNTNKLQQIYQAGILTPEMVQDSIYAFAFDRDVNNKQYNNPIGFIMSLLKVKGMPYEFPQNYESPRDAALRRYMEQKQAQRERAKQLQNLLKQDAFESWLMTLSADETEKLIPSEVRKNESLRRGALLNHFQTHIWPEEEKKLADRAGA